MISRRQFLGGGAAAGLAAGVLQSGCRPLRSGRSTAPAATAPARPVRFTDVTEAAGLAFTQSHGGCGLYYFVENVAAGAALLDADGDGHLDIYFPQPKPLGKCSR